MKPFGLKMPEKATSPVHCLVHHTSDSSSVVVCPYFSAVVDATGKVLRCFKLEQSPASYTLHCESYRLRNIGNEHTVETVWTKDHGALSLSSLMEVRDRLFSFSPLLCSVLFSPKLWKRFSNV